jgi:hypothetical protein
MVFTYSSFSCFFYFFPVKKARGAESTGFFPKEIPFTLMYAFLYFMKYFLRIDITFSENYTCRYHHYF